MILRTRLLLLVQASAAVRARHSSNGWERDCTPSGQVQRKGR